MNLSVSLPKKKNILLQTSKRREQSAGNSRKNKAAQQEAKAVDHLIQKKTATCFWDQKTAVTESDVPTQHQLT